MVKVFTGVLWRWKGPYGLDVTVKGQDPLGKFFAPTWDIVMGHKKGLISDAKYTSVYHDLMLKSYRDHRDVWENLLAREYLVLLCYCRPGKFCHRHILAEYLGKLGAEVIGEVPSNSKYYR